MPARNSIKEYNENGYYHLYNRGVEKRIIFIDGQDYNVFLHYLKDYLTPKDQKTLQEKLLSPETSYREKDKILKLLRLNNFSDEITFLAFCLMPNHFHFLIKQKNANSINKFIQSLCTRYTMYFNRKYSRVGSLFQSVYKAVLVRSDEQLLELTRYIHKQALALQGETLQELQPNSYYEYIGKRVTDWIKTDEILNYFSRDNNLLSYEAFVSRKDDLEKISKLVLEEI